jgi:hypothetical protein
MAYQKPSPFSEWLLILRERWPVMRRQAGEWVGQVREEPILLWQTPAIRYCMYAVGVLIFIWLISIAAGSIAPPLPEEAKARAKTADFHVICTDERCMHHWMINREFGFDDFPVQCPKCNQMTGRQAVRCYSGECKGQWVVPTEREGVRYCPICGQPIR